MNKAFTFFLLLVFSLSKAQEKTGLQRIIPHHLKGQYAGGIGLVSVGAGYRLANNKLETDLHFGWVPERFAGENLEILTAKLTWIPVRKVNISDRIFTYPFTTGLHANYTHSDNLILDLSTKYPKGYYGWTTAVHAGIFIGAKAGITPRNGSEERVMFYTELGMNEIEMISYAINLKALRPWDVLNIALGLQVILRD